MLKARKGETLIFGLSEMNITRMKLGQPIKFNLKELGLEDRTVFLFYGKDEAEMKKMFSHMIGPDTDYRDTSSIPNN